MQIQQLRIWFLNIKFSGCQQKNLEPFFAKVTFIHKCQTALSLSYLKTKMSLAML